MKTLIGFFDSMAQVRKAIERLGGIGFTAQTMAISQPSGTAETAHHVKSEAPTSPGQDQLPTPTSAMAGTLALGQLNLPPILDQVAPAGLEDQTQNAPAARPIADSGLDSIPGGLRGMLSGWHFPNDVIQDCEAQIAQGRALLTVEIIEDANGERVQAVLSQEGAARIIDSGHLKV